MTAPPVPVDFPGRASAGHPRGANELGDRRTWVAGADKRLPDQHHVGPHWWYSLTSSGVATVMFTMFVGFYFVQHWIGVKGMPRRIANHPDLPGNVTVLNETSSVGSWVLTL
jgi:hypothetical protein